MAIHVGTCDEVDFGARLRQPVPPQQWDCSAELVAVQRLNCRVISACARMAVRPEGHQVPCFLMSDRVRWASLTLEQCEALSQMPFSVLDLRFSDAEWWNESLRKCGAPLSARNDGAIPASYAGEWTQEVLAISLRLASRSRFAARFLFGMTAAVAECFGAASDVPTGKLAAGLASELRLRWTEASNFWITALVAVQSEKMDEVRRLRRHGVQLLGGW